MLVVIVGGYIAMGVASNPGGITRLLGKDSTLTGRTQLWSLVWKLIRSHPWFGYGYGGFWLGLQGPSAPVWRAVGWQPPNAHNGFLDLLLDLGIIGLLLFVPVILTALRHAFTLARRGRTLDTAFPLIFLFFLLISNIIGLTQLGMNAPDVVSADRTIIHHLVPRCVRTRSTA